MTARTDAPTPEDLALAEIEGSSLFGVTNAAGKVLTAVAGAIQPILTVGAAQTLGYLGPIGGMTLSLPVTIGLAAAGIATGLTAYWLGDFDDSRIKSYNEGGLNARSAFTGASREDFEPVKPDEIMAAMREGKKVLRQLGGKKESNTNPPVSPAINGGVAVHIENDSSSQAASANAEGGNLSGIFSDSSSGEGEGQSIKDVNGLAQAAPLIAAVGSYIAFGAAVWKNFFDRAPDIDISRTELQSQVLAFRRQIARLPGMRGANQTL